MALSQQEANKLISQKIAEATALITECENIADENGVDFSLHIGGYGMGGWYNHTPKEGDEDWNSSSCEGYDDYVWQSSSSSC